MQRGSRLSSSRLSTSAADLHWRRSSSGSDDPDIAARWEAALSRLVLLERLSVGDPEPLFQQGVLSRGKIRFGFRSGFAA
jgi:hypothetical protein